MSTSNDKPTHVVRRDMNSGDKNQFADHFSGSAAAYANYRPAYPNALIEELASLAPGRSLAWDCATGSGQAARQLASFFDAVIATDASAEQIRNALPHPRVRYAVGREDESGAAINSVQLVTVATALHWLDLDRFYGEARRVLVPEGVIAAWGYGYPSVSPAIDAVIQWFGKERVARFWPPERRHLENGFRELAFPFEPLRIETDSMTVPLTREQFAGYVDTWSAVAVARSSGVADPIVEFRSAIGEHWGDEVRDVTWPIYSKVGRA